MDLSIGKWMTILRISPAISVTVNTNIHMKTVELNLSPKDALMAVTERPKTLSMSPTSLKRKFPADEGDRIIDLTKSDRGVTEKKTKLHTYIEDPSSPLRTRSNNEEVEFVGVMPVRLSSFPARTVGEMVTRIEWIVTQDEPKTTAARFQKVFSCDFKGPTYYKHQGIWKWLKDNGRLSCISGTDLWAPLASTTLAAMKETKEGRKRE